MGSCQQSDVIEVNSHRNRDFNESSEIQENESIEKQKQEFPDMPEWEGDKYVGIGLKRMKGYKCDMPIDLLNQKREEFWEFRSSRENPNYRVWEAINQAVVYDEVRANMHLEENGLTTYNGCINHIIDQDGNHYHIPNYCINDPYFEKKFKEKKNIEEKKIKIIMYEPSENINDEKSLVNTMTGKELKALFKKDHNIGDNYKLRLFFGGQEIKDEQFLYQHNLKREYKIQVMKIPLFDVNSKSEKTDKKKEKEKEKDKKAKKKKKKKNKEGEKDEGSNQHHHHKRKDD